MSQSPVCMPLEKWQDLVEVACMATGHWRERFWAVASFPVGLLAERLPRQSSERKGSRCGKRQAILHIDAKPHKRKSLAVPSSMGRKGSLPDTLLAPFPLLKA